MFSSNKYYEGDKGAVILLHSYTSYNRDVDSLARFLNREGYAVYTPNLSGHGEGELLDSILDFNITHWTKDVDDAITYMINKGFKKVALFGLSLGGILSLNALVNDNRVFAGGSFSASLNLNELNGLIDFFMITYKNQMKDYDVILKSRLEIEHELNVIFDEVRVVNKKSLEKLDMFSKPIFIAQGGKDEIINANDTVAFRNMLSKNQIHFYWYEEAPHVITIGAPGMLLRRHLLNFLQTLKW